ncbi:MAG TPA: discoidin domain-containing protein [Pyrinomonadaceae bacterium]|nr:discoidin domain-containing protein [Pyrinomonadaceae bacterium]
MKRCSKCHRAYEDDTLRFCLEDGSPLFDARDSEAPATEILPARGTPTLKSTGPTVPSYQAVRRPSPEISEARGSNPVLTVGVIAIVGLLLALVAIAGVFVFRQSREKEPEVARTATPPPSPTAGTRPGVVDSAETLMSPSTGAPLKITSSASSVRLAVQANTYYAANAIDGKRATAWIEGADGPGIGEWIRFDFDREITLRRILWQPGYFKSPAIWNQNNRLATVSAEFSDGTWRELKFADRMDGQKMDVGSVRTRWVKFVITAVHYGSDPDTALSEVAFEWEP